MVEEIVKEIIKAFKNEKKVLICGNGGSSSMASHFAGELVCKFKKDRRALPALSLNDPTIITAIGNDLGFKYVFSRQIEAYGSKGDVLITLSTSGTSQNIIEAQNVAFKMGLVVIKLPTNNDLMSTTDSTQEIHLLRIHQICELVEKEFE